MANRFAFCLMLILTGWGCAAARDIPGLTEVSGIAKLGDALLMVDDHDHGVYLRYPLRGERGPLIRIDPRRVKRVSLWRPRLGIDLESIDVLADGRVVALSERLRALISKAGIVAHYESPLAEFGGRGLEGLAVDRLPDRSSRIAVLWEGGYPSPHLVQPQLRKATAGRSLRPVILVHELKPGQSGLLVRMSEALRLIELDVPVPQGLEPDAQRFRAPDLVWDLWTQAGDDPGFIVIISSLNGLERPAFAHHWLQRFSSDGKPVGEPLDLDGLAPEELKGVNWEGLSWFEEGKSLLLIHERGYASTTNALVVPLPESWRAPAWRQQQFTHVIERGTEYYLAGPQQARPPDGRLPAGTRVAIVQDAGSYCLVRAETGVEAYVATDALRPRPDE